MHCRACNYVLWNISARQCPECGTAFKPSEFEFTPGSVRYLCPVCSKGYYGTSEKGHLVPRSFSCVQCGTAIDMDEMILTPAQGVSEDLTRPVELPWLARERRSPLIAALRTCGWALGRPGDVGRALPPSGAAGRAWRFLVLVQVACWSVQIGAILLLPALVAGGKASLGFLVGWLITVIVMFMLMCCVFVPIWGIVAHFILRSSGTTRGGGDVTFSTICYTGGANLPTAIPFVGYFLGPLWWLISAVFALRESQRVSTGRAALAVLPVPIVTVGILVGGYISLAAWGVGMAVRAASMARPPGIAATVGANTVSIHSALADQLVARSDPAADPFRAIADARIPPDAFLVPGSATKAANWGVSGASLAQLPLLTRDEFALFEERRRALPQATPGVVRVADAVVLTDAGLYNGTLGNLWAVIMWPDPLSNPQEDPSMVIHVACADGTTVFFGYQFFDAALAAENSRRAEHSLPPIPHPRTVK